MVNKGTSTFCEHGEAYVVKICDAYKMQENYYNIS